MQYGSSPPVSLPAEHTFFNDFSLELLIHRCFSCQMRLERGNTVTAIIYVPCFKKAILVLNLKLSHLIRRNTSIILVWSFQPWVPFVDIFPNHYLWINWPPFNRLTPYNSVRIYNSSCYCSKYTSHFIFLSFLILGDFWKKWKKRQLNGHICHEILNVITLLGTCSVVQW